MGRSCFKTGKVANWANTSIRLSKTLSFILRHGAHKVGLQLQKGGYLYIDELLKLDQLKCYNLEDVMAVVDTNDKNRYHVEKEQGTGRLKIRANQGHSIEVDDLELTPVTDTSQYTDVIHGTYMKYWPSIRSEGLKRMGRTHIHFAPSEPERGQVISGMRGSCDIVVYIDLPLALNGVNKKYHLARKKKVWESPGVDFTPEGSLVIQWDLNWASYIHGLKFFVSANGVILTPGNEHGVLLPKYFKKVINRKSKGTDAFHQCVDQHLPLITAILNSSMDESVMPWCLKRATITPLLKRSGLDKEEMKDYRPISNLPFISSLIENVLAMRIEEHLDHNDLLIV
ncbi:hypothetical protein LSH36_685g02020 [Paralvinella palmiformis]|uniref:2'-phosphotransferase n=1 Tax=Paralvinella palmiformis TaxID=53620 RepID=A0AAD9MV95_9ANNE|nr:hypothetical protein LSH36_685g02020 [Paralvinella palmiformis]